MSELEIFEKALEIQDPKELEAFLDQACGDDTNLRQRIEKLLQSHLQSSQFLNVPLMDQLQQTNVNENEATIQFRPNLDTEMNEEPAGPDLSFLQPPTTAGTIGILGHYQVLEILGQGAFGIVFKAFDEKLHRHVALKVLSPQIAATSPPRKRFLREARSVAAIKHENIVQIYSVEEQPLPHLAMEFVDGQTLQNKMDDAGPVDIAELLHLARQMAAGLAAAHEKGLIHRDIKPGNILIERGVEQKVKITDFGLARAADDATMTQTGTIAGTPMYMAPEQAMAQAIDHRADLFSLGSVLYQMACGRPPFRGAGTLAVLKRVVEEEPRSIREILPEVPNWLVALIAKLHAKNPEDRFQSARELADLLARCQAELQTSGRVTCVDNLIKENAGPATIDAKAPTPNKKNLRVGSLVAIATACCLLLALAIYFNPSSKNLSGDLKQAATNPTESKNQAQQNASDDVKTELAASLAAPSEQSSSNPAEAIKKPLDLTPLPPLGSWEMGPEPPWFVNGTPTYSLKDDPVLPGIIERPRLIPGIKRWNVDAVWSRGWTRCVRWSPDGKWIATGSSDGHVRLYDASTLELFRILPGAGFSEGLMDLSWHPDSQRLVVTADATSRIRILYLDGQAELDQLVTGVAVSVCWNHAGTQFAVGYQLPWDVQNSASIEIRSADGHILRTLVLKGIEFPPGFRGNSLVAWSADDRRLLAWHADGKIRIWNINDETEQILDEVGIDGYPGHRIAISEDDWLGVATGTEVRIYNEDQKKVHTIPSNASYLAWRPGDKLLYGASQQISTFDRETGATNVGAYRPGAERLAWSPDGKVCCEAGIETTQTELRLWTGDFKKLLRETPAGQAPLGSLEWSPDGAGLISGSQYFDPTRLWSIDGKLQHCWEQPNLVLGGWFAWQPDGQQLFAGQAGRLWSLDPKTRSARILLNSDKLYWGGSVAWSADGRFAVFGTTDGNVQVIDQNGKPIAKMRSGSEMTFVAWNHARNRIAVATIGQPLQFCEPDQGWTLRTVGDKPLEYFQEPIAWSPDGELLAVPQNGWYDSDGRRINSNLVPRQAYSWRADSNEFAASGGPLMELFRKDADRANWRFHNGNSYFVSYHPSGKLVSSGTQQATITTWHASDLQPYWHAVMLPEGKSATFSAAGELLDGNPAEIDQYLVYYIDRGDGKIETLKPDEFRKLIPD